MPLNTGQYSAVQCCTVHLKYSTPTVQCIYSTVHQHVHVECHTVNTFTALHSTVSVQYSTVSVQTSKKETTCL